MKQQLYSLTEYASTGLQPDQVLLAHLIGEHSDFVRFNRCKVRQAMSVRQAQLSLALLTGRRRMTTRVAISGDAAADRALVSDCVGRMQAELGTLPEDPYLIYSTEPSRSERIRRGRLPSAGEALEVVLGAGAGTDLVGYYAAGPAFRGFASSLGHRHFHEVETLQLDWSLFIEGDTAVKSSYSSSEWNGRELGDRIATAKAALEHLRRPKKTIEPGRYRVYFAPTAVAELVAMLNWGGVSEKAVRTQNSCLQKLVDGSAQFSQKLVLRENTAAGLEPAFDELGFEKPPIVDLIVAGRHVQSLVSPRTAKEYGTRANADSEEVLRSAEIAPGDLPAEQALQALDTGIYVSNLWYLNFSDRPSARVTGMTRFATFWIENGRIVAPLNVMRFDDSLYRLLGSHLLELTRERELIVSTSTYGYRSLESKLLPGALVSEVAFTL
jgi:predicted Zn-dependent protease